jgi:hypothetical protein
MQRVCFILILILILGACGGSEPGSQPLPTRAPAVDLPGQSNGNGAPRVTETPDPGLPPTWTPAPTSDNSQSFTTNAAPGAVVITGTRFVHIVQRGDTLSKLAIRYSVPVTDLARINNIVNWDIIEVGQELVVPVTGVPEP